MMHFLKYGFRSPIEGGIAWVLQAPKMVDLFDLVTDLIRSCTQRRSWFDSPSNTLQKSYKLVTEILLWFDSVRSRPQSTRGQHRWSKARLSTIPGQIRYDSKCNDYQLLTDLFQGWRLTCWRYNGRREWTRRSWQASKPIHACYDIRH